MDGEGEVGKENDPRYVHWWWRPRQFDLILLLHRVVMILHIIVLCQCRLCGRLLLLLFGSTFSFFALSRLGVLVFFVLPFLAE